MDLLKKVISECYFLLEEKNSYSDTCQGLENPDSSLRKGFLDKILKNVVYKMCIGIFVEPYPELKLFFRALNTFKIILFFHFNTSFSIFGNY
jgi:hypothetical protein